MTCKPCKEMPVLRHTVTIERPAGTVDAAGHLDESESATWLPVATRKCSVSTRGGSEGYRFSQVSAEVSHLIEMRSDPTTRTIIPLWRLQLGGRAFAIRAAYDVDEARKTVRCECTEQV